MQYELNGQLDLVTETVTKFDSKSSVGIVSGCT